MKILDTSLFVLSLDSVGYTLQFHKFYETITHTHKQVSPGETKTCLEGKGWDAAAMRQALCGDVGANRNWQPRHFDKLTVHVAPDSSAAFMFEHSPYDAVPLFRMFADVHMDATGVVPLPKHSSFSSKSCSI